MKIGPCPWWTSEWPICMDFALLQVSWESISRIFFRVNAQTETVDAFEYPERRFLVSMRHDYIIKPVSTLKRHEVAESIASASVWRRGARIFSNKVDLMETFISWVVCRTLILLLRYSIVGTTIILWNCVAYHVREARYDHRVYCRINRVQFFLILLCKSEIRHLFFPSFLHSQPFVPFGLDSGFRLLGVRLAVHVHFACLLSGNPKMSNPEPEKKTRWKPESEIH